MASVKNYNFLEHNVILGFKGVAPMPVVTTQFPASLSLSNLNGKNGFALPGVAINGYSGYSVSNAGDINSDGIADLIIGAPYAFGGEGVCYVVFGSHDIGSSGTFSLSNLDGVNGFVIKELSANSIGISVGAAGDVNNDGIDDLIIGAPYDLSQYGVSYVIFGKVDIGSTGTFSISSLNGVNGFALPGYVYQGATGVAVSTAGDINDDGIADFIIAADNANSYVVFGHTGIGSSGTFSLSSLNGTNGFVTYGGNAVSGGGDINGDGISDLLIGSQSYSGQVGVCYVIFGHANIGGAGNLYVTNLNGTYGFTILGTGGAGWEFASSVDAADINGDGIADLLIASQGISTFVIFGSTNIGSTGSFSLTSLNGSNGFIFVKAQIGNGLGGAISAEDINNDGFVDLIVGAPQDSSSIGMTYVIFGKVDIGSSGILTYSDLNGENGFAISGIAIHDQAGYFVRTAGDINDDGIADLIIGTPYALGNAGSSYVIFGDSLINLLNNRLTIKKGNTIIFTSLNLNATLFKSLNRNPSLIFSISNVERGQFEEVSNPGLAITRFTQQQIHQNQIQFVHDDSLAAPSYAVSVSDGGISALIPPAPAQITFIHLGPLLVANAMLVNQGQTMFVTNNQLSAIDLDILTDNPNLIFTISGMQYGYFQFIYNPGVPIYSFIQAQLQTANVEFVHDGNIHAPRYNVTVSDGGISTPSQAGDITFNLIPILINNTLSLSQGEVVTLSHIDISATDPDDSAASLLFLASNILDGHFELISNSGTVITSFTQGEVQSGDVQFFHDGSANPPSYSIAVSDGKFTTPSQPSVVSFSLAPSLRNNALTINQGEKVIITGNDLSAIDPDSNGIALVFIISQVLHGQFELASKPGMAITRFTQGQVQNSQICFVQDGSSVAPSYMVAVSDGRVGTSPQMSAINFNAAPVLINNQLTLIQAQSVTISSGDISAYDQQTAAGELIFTASDITHGHFEDSNNPGVAIKQFSQQRIYDNALKFVADGSSYAPAYNLSVSDASLTTMPSPAIINFSLDSTLNAVSDNTVRNAIIGGSISGGIGLLFLFLKLYLTAKATVNMQKTLQGGKTEIEKEQETYYKEIIRPIANKIFEHIDTSGFLGYQSEKEIRSFLDAIELVVEKIKHKGISLDLKSMQPLERNILLKIIAEQTKNQVVKKQRLCSTATLLSFFKPETTPLQIEHSADAIATTVQKVLDSDLAEPFAGTVSRMKIVGPNKQEGITQLEDVLDSKLQQLETRVNQRLEKIDIEMQKLLEREQNISEVNSFTY